MEVRTNWKPLIRSLCKAHNQWGFSLLDLEGKEIPSPPALPGLTEEILTYEGPTLVAKAVRGDVWKKYRRGEYSFIYSIYDKDTNTSFIGLGNNADSV